MSYQIMSNKTGCLNDILCSTSLSFICERRNLLSKSSNKTSTTRPPITKLNFTSPTTLGKLSTSTMDITPTPNMALKTIFQSNENAFYSIKSIMNNKYVSAGRGDANLTSNKDEIESMGEIFKIVKNSDQTFSFISAANNMYVSAFKTSPLIANKKTIDKSEKFYLVSNADNSISIKSAFNSKYVSANNLDTTPLAALYRLNLLQEHFVFDQLVASDSAITSKKLIGCLSDGSRKGQNELLYVDKVSMTVDACLKYCYKLRKYSYFALKDG